MITLRLQCEQPTDPTNQKVYLDGQKLVCWYGGGYQYQYGLSVVNVDETIKINNSNADNDNTYNVENNTVVVPSGSTFTAVYPATTTAGDFNTANEGTVTYYIPAVQTFTPGPNNTGQNLRDLPMAAYMDPRESGVPPVLMFRNLASLIKVTVHNPSTSKPYRLNSIKLSSTNGQPLHGKFTYTFSHSTNNTAPGTPTPSGTQPAYSSEVMLDFNHAWETVAPNGSRDFYIIVAPFSNSSLRIQIRGALLGDNSADHYSNGSAIKVCTKEYAASKSLVRNMIGIFDITPDQLNGFTISGGFTVASGQVSYFSPGNLSLGYSSQSEYTWCFYTNVKPEQYDCWGSLANYTSWSLWGSAGVAEHYFDLFQYTTAVSAYDVGTYYPINMNYADQTWRCPSSFDWNSVIRDRTPVSTVNGTVNARFVKATIKDRNYLSNNKTHCGIILFPDAYIQPDIGNNLNDINSTNAAFSRNNLEYVKWKLMEAAGAVFLPTTGRLINFATVNSNYTMYAQIEHDNEMGYYWGKDITTLEVGGNIINFDTYSRFVFNSDYCRMQPPRLNFQEVDDIEQFVALGINWAYINNTYIAIRPIRN